MDKHTNKKPDLIKNLEVEGITVEDAIQKALKMLNVTREEIKIKVVSEEKKGLFGMEGEKPAKIKISIIENKSNSEESNISKSKVFKK